MFQKTDLSASLMQHLRQLNKQVLASHRELEVFLTPLYGH